MADKLEVLTGPGLVARFADVSIWAGPQATPALQAHLVSEARRLAQVPQGGDQLAHSFISVLQRGDPEPQAPYATCGPGPNGLTLFLHGPVQAWDSGRWLAPQPVPGWMVTSVGRPWPLIVMAYGASPPPPSQQGNPFDLGSGAVPGAGFVLLRLEAQSPPAYGAPSQAHSGPPSPVIAGSPALGQAPYPIAQQPQGHQPAPNVGAGPGYGPTAGYGPGPTYAPGPGAGAPPPTGSFSTPSPQASPSTSTSLTFTPAAAAAAAAVAGPNAPATTTTTAPPGVVDLRSVTLTGRAPLALASDWPGPSGPERPTVPGVNCERGHFNNPRSVTCARCGRPIPAGTPQLSGARPALGVLLVDDGSVYTLGRGCLIGAGPDRSPEVQSGPLQPIALRAADNHTMAPVHAEVQLRGWDVYVVDRVTPNGTFALVPGEESWRQLAPGEQKLMPAGTHISCGGRVLTFLSNWGT